MVQTLWVKEQLEKYSEFRSFYRSNGYPRRQNPDVALAKIGDKGLFTKELEAQMLVGHADIAVFFKRFTN